MSEVVKLVERFRKRCAMKGGCQDSRDPEKCAWCQCADEIEALATAPPDEPQRDAYGDLIPPERSVKVTYGKPTKEQVEKFERTAKEMIEGTQPQAVSVGALAADIGGQSTDLQADRGVPSQDTPRFHLWEKVYRLHQKEGILMGEALERVAAAHDQKVREVLQDANDVCRSAYQIAARRGAETNWDTWITRLEKALKAQQDVLYPPAQAASKPEPRNGVELKLTVPDGWTPVRTSFYKELLAIATEKATNDSTK